MEQLRKPGYVLSEVLMNSESLTFKPIPEKYKRFHQNLLLLQIYEMFDKKIHMRNIFVTCIDTTKKVYLHCEKMEEVFVPNFAFMIYCIFGDNSLAVELYDLGDVDDFVLVHYFRLCYNKNENIAEFCLKKYAKYKRKKNT